MELRCHPDGREAAGGSAFRTARGNRVTQKQVLRSLRLHQDDTIIFLSPFPLPPSPFPRPYFLVALYAMVAPAAGSANAATSAAILSFIGFTFVAAGTAKYSAP